MPSDKNDQGQARGSELDDIVRVKQAIIFEKAIEETGFGVFNVGLLLLSELSLAALIFETSRMSYIMPMAECDLKLTVTDKGNFHTLTYAGMVLAELPWAVISDIKGRKWVLVCAHLMNSVCAFGCACSRSFLYMVIFKFLGGVTIVANYSTLITYISEMHKAEYRTRAVLLIGILLSLSAILLPILATLIVPHKWSTTVIGFEFQSWQVFTAVCGLPGLIFGCLFIFFPESPKFDMTQGNYEAALKTLQKIFYLNTGKPAEEYPIKTLESDEIKARKSLLGASMVIKRGWHQLELMLNRRYFGLALLVYMLNFVLIMGPNTLRLWLPQLFASYEEIEKIHGETNRSFCDVLAYNVNKTATIKQYMTCEVHISIHSYLYNLLVSVISIIFYVVAIILLKYISSKLLMCGSLLIACILTIGLFFAYSKMASVLIAAFYLALKFVAASALLYSVAVYFPTQIRATVMSFTLLFGRISTSLGNMIFPYCLKLGCLPPIIFMGILGCWAFVTSIFLPNPSKMVFK